MKVTLVPAQIAPAGTAAILTLGVTIGLTVIVVAAEVAVAGAAQAKLDVITTVTLLPLASVVLVKVALVAPATFVPLTCH